MPEYAFDRITTEQALAFKAGDTLTFSGAPARTAVVVYQAYDPLVLTPEVPKVFVTYGGRTVAFSTDITQVSRAGGLVMADGSRLYIGDAGGDAFTAGAGDDGLYGGPGGDILNGAGGGDLLQGNGGDDTLTGGDGADSIYGGQGDDVIHTGRDASGATGDQAGDWANGNLGDDQMFGGAGGDTLLGGQGNDLINGGAGDDYLSGDLGDDQLFGGEGFDTLVGGAGNDTLSGGFGPQFLNGGDGDDVLTGRGAIAATMIGGAGSDTIVAASSAKDLLLGGEGKDRFEIVVNRPIGEGPDAEIRDWEAHDKIHFADVSVLSVSSILPRSYSEFAATDYATALSIANEHISAAGAIYVAAQVGNDVWVFADRGDPADGADVSILLTGRTLADISLDNFV